MIRIGSLISVSAVVIPSLCAADNLSGIARPAFNATPKANVSAAAVGKPIEVAAMLGLTVTPENQNVVVGSPASYSIKTTAVGISSPITLSVKADVARPYTISPNPVAPGGTATLVFQTALTDAVGSFPFQIIGAAGDRSATKPTTLTLTDPECGNGPVSLNWVVTGLSFQFMTGQKPAPATAKFQLLNSGGRINQNSPRVRIFTLNSDCVYGSCISGPIKAGTTDRITWEVDGRGGCARLVWAGSVPVMSSIPPQTCLTKPNWKFYLNATADLAGIGGAGGKGAEFGCAASK